MSLAFETCSLKELCCSFGGNEKQVIVLQEKLAEWLKLQPHLPRDISKKRLEWFIVTNKMSLERAKRKLDMYYTMRRLIPEFFKSRDPRGPSLTALHEQVQSVVLPKLTPGKYRTFLFRLHDTGSVSKLDLWELCKYIFMVADIRMIEDYACGENIVVDLSSVSLSHVLKFTPALLKKCQIPASNGYASYVKGIHFINAPPIVDSVLILVKSALHPKLLSRIHVYRVGNLEAFYEFVPKSVLPKDYGGDEQSMAELAAALRDKVDEWRDWFFDQENILVDEDLRPTSPALTENNIYGFTGSFRKLEVD